MYNHSNDDQSECQAILKDPNLHVRTPKDSVSNKEGAIQDIDYRGSG